MQSKKGFTPLKVSSSLYFKFLTIDNTNMADETTRVVRATLTPLDIFSFKKVTDFRKKKYKPLLQYLLAQCEKTTVQS